MRLKAVGRLKELQEQVHVAGLPAIAQSFLMIFQGLGMLLYSSLRLQFVGPVFHCRAKPPAPAVMRRRDSSCRIASFSFCSARVTLLLRYSRRPNAYLKLMPFRAISGMSCPVSSLRFIQFDFWVVPHGRGCRTRHGLHGFYRLGLDAVSHRYPPNRSGGPFDATTKCSG